MDIQEIRHQHYVSWFYLKNWLSVSEKQQHGIWTKRGSEDPVHVQGRNNVAQIVRFYEIQIDRDVLDMLKYKYAFHMNNQHVVDTLARLEKLYRLGIHTPIKSPDYKTVAVMNNNFLENSYGTLEGSISLELAKLVKGRWKSFDGAVGARKSRWESLLKLYATQLFRTTHMRELLVKEIESLGLKKDAGLVVFSESQKGTLLKLLSYLESMLLFESLRQSKPEIKIYHAQCDAQFNTSNAPAQNLSYRVNSLKQFIEYQGQMPLSPMYFMTIRKNCGTKKKISIISVEQLTVDRFNMMFMRSNRGSELYATSRVSLLGI